MEYTYRELIADIYFCDIELDVTEYKLQNEKDEIKRKDLEDYAQKIYKKREALKGLLEDGDYYFGYEEGEDEHTISARIRGAIEACYDV